MTTIPKTEIRRLNECATATNSATGFMLEKPARFKQALAAGLVESNAAIAEGDKIAFRISAAGMRYLVSEEAQSVLGADDAAADADANETADNLHNPVDTAVQPATVITTAGPQQTFNQAPQIAPQQQRQSKMSDFEIVTVPNLEEFTKRSRNVGDRKYPFDQLETGQGFSVYPSEDMPEPWKSLQSTVSTASRRYATVTGTYTNDKGKERNEYEFSRKFVVKKLKDGEGNPYAMVVRTI